MVKGIYTVSWAVTAAEVSASGTSSNMGLPAGGDVVAEKHSPLVAAFHLDGACRG